MYIERLLFSQTYLQEMPRTKPETKAKMKKLALESVIKEVFTEMNIKTREHYFEDQRDILKRINKRTFGRDRNTTLGQQREILLQSWVDEYFARESEPSSSGKEEDVVEESTDMTDMTAETAETVQRGGVEEQKEEEPFEADVSPVKSAEVREEESTIREPSEDSTSTFAPMIDVTQTDAEGGGGDDADAGVEEGAVGQEPDPLSAMVREGATSQAVTKGIAGVEQYPVKHRDAYKRLFVSYGLESFRKHMVEKHMAFARKQFNANDVDDRVNEHISAYLTLFADALNIKRAVNTDASYEPRFYYREELKELSMALVMMPMLLDAYKAPKKKEDAQKKQDTSGMSIASSKVSIGAIIDVRSLGINVAMLKSTLLGGGTSLRSDPPPRRRLVDDDDDTKKALETSIDEILEGEELDSTDSTYIPPPPMLTRATRSKTYRGDVAPGAEATRAMASTFVLKGTRRTGKPVEVDKYESQQDLPLYTPANVQIQLKGVLKGVRHC